MIAMILDWDGLEVIWTPNLPLAKRALYQIELQAPMMINI